MGTTSSTAPLYFTGVSTYSSDFQSIIQRAVQIAQQPITNLQNEQSGNLSKKQALITLNPDVASLGADVAALGQLASGQSLAASSSDSSIVSAANTGASTPGSYVISNITSLASAASEMSLTGYANSTSTPVSTSGYVNLVVGSNTYQLNLTNNNNLNGLVSAINNANAGVSASILTTSSGDYLSVTADQTGATTLEVNNVPQTDLISNTGQGTETSLATYIDTTTTPVSSTGKVDLVVGSNTYHLDISANNNLTGLMNAINNAGAGVTASITGSGPYSLSLSASGPVTMQLNDDQTPVNLITSSNQGSNANFTLNGTIHESKASNTISDIIPGVTFTLNKTTNGSVTLSVEQDGSQLATALQTFVTDYNKLVSDVAQQRGTGGGPLAGDLLINTISSDMQQLITYWNPSSSSSIHSLSDLGLQFADNTGQLSFNQETFDSLTNNQISDALKFLGSSSSGLAQLASNFTQLSDPITGLIQDQENNYDQADTELTNRINTMTQRVSQLQASVTTQMQQADALCAQLESNQNMLNASIQSLDYVLYGKQTNANGL
jgi:flagellar hook-associated protein 2